MEALKNKSFYLFQPAENELARIGKPAVDSLLAELKSPSKGVRGRAAGALAGIGPEARTAMNALLQALNDEDEEVRQNAAIALGTLEGDAKIIVPALIEALKREGTKRGTHEMLYSLARFGPEAATALDLLIDVAGAKDTEIRSSVQYTLVKIGKPALSRLIDRVKAESSTPEARTEEITGLAKFGHDATAAVPVLIRALQDKHAGIRSAAARSLCAICVGEKPAVEALIRALKDKDPDVRRAAAAGLGKIGPGAKDAVLAIATTLQDKDPDVRAAAAEGLWRFGPAAKEAVPMLAKNLNDMDARARYWTIRALGSIGPPAKGATKALLNVMTQDSDRDNQNAAVAALIRIDFESMKKNLSARIKDLEGDMWKDAVDIIIMAGPAAKEAVPSLVRLMQREPREAGGFVAEALASMGPAAKDAAGALAQAHRTGALKELGPSAIPQWIDLLNSPLEPFDSSYAHMTRRHAVQVLGEFGPEAKLALPVLRKALNDEHRSVREAAREALKKIER